jgi:biopolymer transport protein ExbD
MGLKKKSKVSAQFNMSSLTDIIFLLLIFFMLTSSLVAPNALNLKLPGKTKAKITNTEKLPSVDIRRNGTYNYNGKSVTLNQLETELKRISRRTASQRSFTIAPNKKSPVESVVAVMDMAMRLNLNAVLLPEK